jgi:Protein of unknown function (DUF3014)
MKRTSIAAIAALVLTALGLGALYWFQWRSHPSPEPVAPPVAEAPPAAPTQAPSEPAIRNPIDASLASAASAPVTGDAQSMWRHGLAELLGQSAVVRFVQTEDFSRRLVVTVDNLARAHAAPRLWPVNPTPGRFSVSGDGELRNIAPENAGRYTPLVTLITSVDARRAAALYVSMYPQLQKTYEELGYPGRYFNDRVIEVIDHLLDTPEPSPAGPLMQLTEVKGSVPSTQPWLRYEFADPELQSLSAGRRILLRVGPAHRQALKAKLVELRKLLARAPVSR